MNARPQAAVAAPIVRDLGLVEYLPTVERMQRFTSERGPDTPDEIWLLQHPPVFTLGLAGRREHVLAPGDIPVVQTDRGGQVTYHGPGQLVVYTLIDLRRAGLGVRDIVSALERSVIACVAAEGIEAIARPDAPGVYAGGAKLASLGVRIRRGASYHGLALNVDMDLEPFGRINPCGHAGLAMTQLKDLGARVTVTQAAARLLPHLRESLGL